MAGVHDLEVCRQGVVEEQSGGFEVGDARVAEGGVAVHALALGEVVGAVFGIGGLVVAGGDVAGEDMTAEMGAAEHIIILKLDNFLKFLNFQTLLIQEPH